MDLFQVLNPPKSKEAAPLASRLAPQKWGEFYGQEHLIHSGRPLRRAIEADRLGSSIFFGPPGTGKTALARMAAQKSNAAIEYMNAVTAGVSDIRSVVKRAKERKQLNEQRTLLVIDEIHHFNRSQQDALLPDVERGNLILVGLTTENPYYYVNAALMSRSTAFEFKALSENDLVKILERALKDKERGLGNLFLNLSEEARKSLFALRRWGCAASFKQSRVGGPSPPNHGLMERSLLIWKSLNHPHKKDPSVMINQGTIIMTPSRRSSNQ